MLAIFTLGGAFAWGAARWLRWPVGRSVLASLVALHATACLALVLDSRHAAQHGVQLTAYALGSVLLYRPLCRWIAARLAHGTAAAWLEDQRGLSTLEYAVLFIVLAVGGLVLWRNLAGSASSRLDAGTDAFARTLNDAIVRDDQGSSNLLQGPTGSLLTAATRPTQAPSSGAPQVSTGTPSPAGNAMAAPAPAPAPQANGSGAPAQTEPGLLQSAKEYLLQTPVAQYAVGVGAGILQGYTPGGFLVPSPYASSKPFEIGRAAGQMGAGIAQTFAGLTMVGGGGALTAAGAPTLFTPAGPLGAGMVAIGAPTVVAGTAVFTNGVTSTLAGYGTLVHAMSMSDAANGGGGSSSGGSGSGGTPRTPEAEAARRRALGEDPATGQYRPNEEVTAVRVEQQTGKTLERYQPKPGQKGDWIDRSTGQVYDGCSPAPSAHFGRQWKNYKSSLNDHLAHPTVDRVVVDVSDLKLTQPQLQQLTNYLDNLPAAQQGKIVRIGF